MSEASDGKRVVLSGASGVLGGAIRRALSASGYEIVRLVRGEKASASDVLWDPLAGELDEAAIAGAHAFVHLSGENVASGRWSDKKKRLITESRTKSTELVAGAISRMDPKPTAFLTASAIGWYGDRGDEELTEASSSGSGFLAEVCRAWEDASLRASQAGVRTANLRFGVVLSTGGGALAKLLPIFKLGLGSRVGSGKQVMSWIGLEDAARAVVHVLETPSLSGPVNIVAPRPVTNAEFTEKLAKAVGKGTGVPVPAFVLKTAYGEMGKETVLASQRVVPQRLVESGFEFLHGGVLHALRAEIERTS